MIKRIAVMLFVIAMCQLIFTPSHIAATKNLKIAMIYWRGESKACQRFKDGLKDMGYVVAYTEWNAAQDKNEPCAWVSHTHIVTT